MTLRLERSDDSVTAVFGDVELFRYVHRPEMDPFEGPKPYLHPIRTLAGDVVTGYRPHDHRWHKGIQMTASHVSGQNFWGGGTYLRGRGYVDLPNVGTMRHEEFTDLGPAHLTERLTWRTQAGEHWVDESRTLTVRDVGEGSWTLEFTTSVRNVRDAPLTFGSPTTCGRPLAGYTGLFWRGPRAFTGGEVITSGGGAGNGGSGNGGMGDPGPWLAYVGHHDEVDRASTLLFVDGPDQPTRWFVRNEPFAAVNPSFAFFDELTLAPGATLDLRYRIVIADSAWNRDRVETHVKERPW